MGDQADQGRKGCTGGLMRWGTNENCWWAGGGCYIWGPMYICSNWMFLIDDVLVRNVFYIYIIYIHISYLCLWFICIEKYEEWNMHKESFFFMILIHTLTLIYDWYYKQTYIIIQDWIPKIACKSMRLSSNQISTRAYFTCIPTDQTGI